MSLLLDLAALRRQQVASTGGEAALLTTDAASPGGNEVAQTREPCANTPRPGGESKALGCISLPRKACQPQGPLVWTHVA